MQTKAYKVKVNGHSLKYSHAFEHDEVFYWNLGNKAICGKKVTGRLETNTLKAWAVKKPSCPKCKGMLGL